MSFIKKLKPTKLKIILSVLLFLILLIIILKFLGNCARLECTSPEECAVPAYCYYDGYFIVLLMIVPIIFYILYSYFESEKK